VTGTTGEAGGRAIHEASTTSVSGHPGELGLPLLFSPAEAAAVLRDAGLRDMTECALRTRAYRKQVPFHRNGRKIIFTLSDLHDIAAGEPHSLERRDETAPAATSRPAHAHPSSRRAAADTDPWRPRQPRDCRAQNVHVRRQEPSASEDRIGTRRNAATTHHHGARPVRATGTDTRRWRAHGSGA